MAGSNAQVGKFVQHCQNIAKGEVGGTSSWKDLEELTTTSFPQVYQIDSSPARSTAKLLQQKQLRGLWHQLTQHLRDLGYLNQDAFRLYWKNHKQVLQEPVLLAPVLDGVRIYLAEEKAESIQQLLFGVNDTLNISREWIEEHLSIITEAIARYTSFDGSLPPPKAYTVGERSCYGRSLAFRIRVIYSMDEQLDNAYIFDRSMLKYTFNLNNLLKTKLDEVATLKPNKVTVSHSMWKLLNNIDNLFKAYLKALPKETHDKSYTLVYDLKKKGEELEVANSRILVSKLSKFNSSGNKRKWGKHRIKNATPLDSGMYAYVATRILQIKLWQTSFYQGRIDGHWGLVSHLAALNVQDQEIEYLKNQKKDKQKDNPYSLKSIERLISLEKEKKQEKDSSTVAIDVELLFEVLQQYCRSTHTKAEAQVNDPDELIERLKKEENLNDQQIDEAVLNERNLSNAYPTSDKLNTLDRRVAYPSQKNRSFFGGLLRGIKRIGRWIRDGIKKVLGTVFAFAKIVLDRIRKGVQLFVRGFHYISRLLLGRPILTRETITGKADQARMYATRFQLDFDAVNIIPDSYTTKGLEMHTQQLMDMKKSMFFFIDVITTVIKSIAKLTQPGGWVWLGRQLFRLIFGKLSKLLVGGAKPVVA